MEPSSKKVADTRASKYLTQDIARGFSHELS